MTDESLPWSDPTSDPVGDIRQWIDQARSRPHLVKIKVTQRTYNLLRHQLELSHLWGRNPIYDAHVAAYVGTPIEIDNTLPSVPGWEAVWSS